MVKCDVMNWDEQLAVFKDAIANSPKKRIDVVVANAGIAATPDDVHTTDRTMSLTRSLTVSGFSPLTMSSRERRSRETSDEDAGCQRDRCFLHNQARTALFPPPVFSGPRFIEGPASGAAKQCGRLSGYPDVHPVQWQQMGNAQRGSMS